MSGPWIPSVVCCGNVLQEFWSRFTSNRQGEHAVNWLERASFEGQQTIWKLADKIQAVIHDYGVGFRRERGERGMWLKILNLPIRNWKR